MSSALGLAWGQFWAVSPLSPAAAGQLWWSWLYTCLEDTRTKGKVVVRDCPFFSFHLPSHPSGVFSGHFSWNWKEEKGILKKQKRGLSFVFLTLKPILVLNSSFQQSWGQSCGKGVKAYAGRGRARSPENPFPSLLCSVRGWERGASVRRQNGKWRAGFDIHLFICSLLRSSRWLQMISFTVWDMVVWFLGARLSAFKETKETITGAPKDPWVFSWLWLCHYSIYIYYDSCRSSSVASN